MQPKVKIAHDPKKVVNRLFKVLPERTKNVLVLRFGLGKSTKYATLESIGQEYGITRERVRQIENNGITTIQNSEEMAREAAVFEELRDAIALLGDVVAEKDLLNALSDSKSIQNYIHFLLVLGDFFVHKKENTDFHTRWYIDETVAQSVEQALERLYASLGDDEIIPEADLIDRFLSELKDLNQRHKNAEVLRRWLAMFKKLDSNPLGEWGPVTSPAIRAKGIRDYAYLAMKQHGSPMHFSEVAKAINHLFGRQAHVATCHNELIKDSRFVLVGRGIYALKEWGYTDGVVRDVIAAILKREGPLSAAEIVDRVKKERYVKDSTILVNLNDKKLFSKDADGRYHVTST